MVKLTVATDSSMACSSGTICQLGMHARSTPCIQQGSLSRRHFEQLNFWRQVALVSVCPGSVRRGPTAGPRRLQKNSPSWRSINPIRSVHLRALTHYFSVTARVFYFCAWLAKPHRFALPRGLVRCSGAACASHLCCIFVTSLAMSFRSRCDRVDSPREAHLENPAVPETDASPGIASAARSRNVAQRPTAPRPKVVAPCPPGGNAPPRVRPGAYAHAHSLHVQPTMDRRVTFSNPARVGNVVREPTIGRGEARGVPTPGVPPRGRSMPSGTVRGGAGSAHATPTPRRRVVAVPAVCV